MPKPELPDDAEVIEQFRVVETRLRGPFANKSFYGPTRRFYSEAQAELKFKDGAANNVRIERRVIAMGDWEVVG